MNFAEGMKALRINSNYYLNFLSKISFWCVQGDDKTSTNLFSKNSIMVLYCMALYLQPFHQEYFPNTLTLYLIESLKDLLKRQYINQDLVNLQEIQIVSNNNFCLFPIFIRYLKDKYKDIKNDCLEFKDIFFVFDQIIISIFTFKKFKDDLIHLSNKKYYQKKDSEVIAQYKIPSFKMNQISLVSEYRIPFFTHKDRLISQCTQRLLQLQNQLESKQLKQQLASSLAMKEFSLKKLLQQQDLLIFYLKDQLKELQARRVQGVQFQKAIIEMQEKYLALGELKGIDEAEGQKYLSRLKIEYSELHDVLNQMTRQSSTLYELKLKRTERNFFSEGLLKERIEEYCTIKQKHTKESTINEKLRIDTSLISNQNQKKAKMNLSLNQETKTKCMKLEENKLKLLTLQKEVQKLQNDRQRFKVIQKAAQKDNLVLKSTLEEKVDLMKERQLLLSGLKRQKQSLQKRKESQVQRLNSLQNEDREWKDQFVKEKSSQQVLKSQLQQVTKDKFVAQNELQRLQQHILYLQSIKKSTLRSSLQTQQTLEKSLYFVDQYILINSELLSQMQLLLGQQISKSALVQLKSRNHLKVNRSQHILELRHFLSTIIEKMNRTQTQVDLLTADFNSYKLC